MLDAKQYQSIVRASAWYDLVVTFPFATPWTMALFAGVFSGVDVGLGLPGSVPDLNVMTIALGNLMGSIVLVWSVARLRLGLAVLGRYDAVARALFSLWLINALANGLSWAIAPLLVFEIGFGVLQALPYRRG